MEVWLMSWFLLEWNLKRPLPPKNRKKLHFPRKHCFYLSPPPPASHTKVCNYASAFAATTCGRFTSNDQIICRKAGSRHAKILKEPLLFHCRPRKRQKSGLWLKCLQVTSCEKVTSLAPFSPSRCSSFPLCFLFYLRQGHGLFPSPAVFDKSRPQRAILNSSSTATKAEQAELFPSHSIVCKGWKKTANHPVSIYSPTIVSQPRDHGYARGEGRRARTDTSASGEHVEKRRSAVSPQDVYSWDHQASLAFWQLYNRRRETQTHTDHSR